MSKYYHVKLDCVGVLKWKDGMLKGMLVDESGRSLSPEEVRTLLIEWLRAGRDVGPPCSHENEKGNCMGHDSAEDP